MFRCPEPTHQSSVNARSKSLVSARIPSRRSPAIGISDSCLRNWVRRADIDAGTRPGSTRDEHAELIELRRELRVAKMEVEILKRAAAYFAKENVLPK